MNEKVIRPRLTESEMKTIHRLVDDEYRMQRRQLRYRKMSGDDTQIYSITTHEKNHKQLGKLLKKLNRLRFGKYTINP